MFNLIAGSVAIVLVSAIAFDFVSGLVHLWKASAPQTTTMQEPLNGQYTEFACIILGPLHDRLEAVVEAAEEVIAVAEMTEADCNAMAQRLESFIAAYHPDLWSLPTPEPVQYPTVAPAPLPQLCLPPCRDEDDVKFVLDLERRLDTPDLASLTVLQLRKIAQSRKIPKSRAMRKDQLLKVLA